MARHRHRRDEEDRSEAVQATPVLTSAVDPAGPSAALLDLQARAGNAAVTGLIAGQGPAALRHVIQRQAGEDEAPAKQDTGPEGGTARLTVPGIVSDCPVRSFGITSSPSRGREEKKTGGEIWVLIAIEDYNPGLQTAMLHGDQFETVTISAGGKAIILKEVVISSLSVGQEFVTVTFNYASLDYAK